MAGNTAGAGGGVYASAATNCIVADNSATQNGANYDASSTLAYSCATPLPPGPGNLDADPAFVNTNGWSNLRLFDQLPLHQRREQCLCGGNYGPGREPAHRRRRR